MTDSPLVLLHAFPLDSQMWRAQDELDAQVVALDLPNAGTNSNRSISIDEMARDVAAQLDARQIGTPIVLCGLSIGGYVALSFARQFPERLRALILCDTRAESDSDEAKLKRDEMMEFARQHTPRQVIEKMIPNLLGQTTRDSKPEVVAEVARIGAMQQREGIINTLQALRDRPDARPNLAQINVPTLVLIGEEDAVTPREAAQFLADNIPDARLEVVPQAGHLSNLEAPQAFNAALQTFLESLD